jgi:hypothetical protein
MLALALLGSAGGADRNLLVCFLDIIIGAAWFEAKHIVELGFCYHDCSILMLLR